MIDGRPSTTALRAATQRAMHQKLDRPLVFDDPLALPLLAPLGELATPPRTAPIRAWMAARSRFAEDALARARARGCTQYVLLGAGLDTFAYRQASGHTPAPPLPVFEVDHPDTQRWKRSLLREAGIGEPSGVTYVPVDLARSGLAEALSAAGYRAHEPACFAWLGVTPYLTEDAIHDTLRVVRSLNPRGEIVFDYLVAGRELSWRSRLAQYMIERYVARLGEHVLSHLSPSRLAPRLRESGWSTVDDIDCPALNALYFADRADGLRISGGVARIVHAR